MSGRATIARALAFAALLIWSLATQASAGDRVALVIGNGAYRHATVLPNPKNDAADVAAALRRIGFDVVEGTDLDRRAMEDKVREFGRKLDQSSLALFYYAGHGMQVAGRNHLLPVDAKLDRAGDLHLETIDVNLVLAQMEAEKRVNLVFLDACRNNPLARSFAPRLGTRSASAGPGLASIQSAMGTLIAYATQPDNVAHDGDGRNSPFTAAFLKHVHTPGLEISSLMKRVRSDVVTATNDQQVPWDHSSLMGEVVLVPARSDQPSFNSAALSPPPSAPRPLPPSPDAVKRQVIDAVARRNLTPSTIKFGSEVTKLAFSPDSQLLAVGMSGAVELREIATQRVVRTIKLGRNSPDAVAFSIDGLIIATAADSTIKLWEFQSGQLLRTLKGHRGSITNLAFTPDGTGLVAADNHGTIRLWDIHEGKQKGTLGDRSYTGHLADSSPDGRSIAWSGVDRMVTVWDFASKRAAHKLHGHRDLVTVAKFSPDSRYLASGSSDTAIKIWDLDNKRLLHTLNGHGDRIDLLAFSPEGHWLASGAADNSLKIWNLETGELIKSLDVSIYVAALAVSPDGRWLACADSESRILLWPVGAEAIAAGK
jgi:WD40 repeat protein